MTVPIWRLTLLLTSISCQYANSSAFMKLPSSQEPSLLAASIEKNENLENGKPIINKQLKYDNQHSGNHLEKRIMTADSGDDNTLHQDPQLKRLPLLSRPQHNQLEIDLYFLKRECLAPHLSNEIRLPAKRHFKNNINRPIYSSF